MADEGRAGTTEDEPDLTVVQPFLKPFPATEDVFVAGDLERASRLIDPLVSIDLSAVDPTWSGWIHIVSPIEPLDGYLGEDTEPFHNRHCGLNWIGFRLNESNRYEFLADWRYFLAESDDRAVAGDTGIDEHYASERRSFAQVRDAYREHGRLLSMQYADRYGMEYVLQYPLAFVETWNEGPGEGNWSGNDALEVVRVPNEEGWDDAYPVTEDGRPFRFIAAVPGWHYRDSGADSILLFFDPVTRVALVTFDWT
ncbi:hypothetical protein D3248_11740 [Leucobacter zeae]|nr:hypothetical protein [Leucobacter zeae]